MKARHRERVDDAYLPSDALRACRYFTVKQVIISYKITKSFSYRQKLTVTRDLSISQCCDKWFSKMSEDGKGKADSGKKMTSKAPEKSNVVVKTIVTSPEIYKPVGPYSQAILVDKTLYVSGVLGLDREAKLVCGGPAAEARQALENMRHVLEAGGASLASVIKTTILLNDIQDFQAVNGVYAEFFTQDYPARATFQVGKLPLGAAVEIEAIALSGDLQIAEAGPCPCSRK